MPKTVIQRPDTEASTPTEIALHWSKEAGHVQLSITQYPFGVAHVGGALDAEGQPVIEPVTPHTVDVANTGADPVHVRVDYEKVAAADAGTGPDNPYARDRLDVTTTALYSDAMTRHQINELIRALRRARDAAFGADA